MPYIPFGEVGEAIRSDAPRILDVMRVSTEELIVVGNTPGVVRSQNYDAATVGWAVFGSGEAFFYGGIRVKSGSASTPGISFATDADNGIFLSGTDKLGIAVGGAQVIDIGATRVSIYGTDFLKVPIKNSTGDPSSPVNGDIYVNTVDNKARVFCDSAWHDMAAW